MLRSQACRIGLVSFLGLFSGVRAGNQRRNGTYINFFEKALGLTDDLPPEFLERYSLAGQGRCHWESGAVGAVWTQIGFDECWRMCSSQDGCVAFSSDLAGENCTLGLGLPSIFVNDMSESVCWVRKGNRFAQEATKEAKDRLRREVGTRSRMLSSFVWDMVSCSDEPEVKLLIEQLLSGSPIPKETLQDYIARVVDEGIPNPIKWKSWMLDSFYGRPSEEKPDVGCVLGRTAFFYYFFVALDQISDMVCTGCHSYLDFAREVLGDPEAGMNLLQSTGFGVTLWDIVVITRDGYLTYSHFDAARSPLPPYVVGPSATNLEMPSRRESSGNTQLLPCGKAKVASLGMQRFYQMHKLSAMQAAWRSVCGVGSVLLQIDLWFEYTIAGPMGDDVRYEASGGGVERWHDMTVSFSPNAKRLWDLDSLDAIELDLQGVFSDRSSALFQADLWLCGEPVYVCTAANRILQKSQDLRPLLAVPAMTLLHQAESTSNVLADRKSVAVFYNYLAHMLLRPASAMAVGNRFTSEQVFMQMGVRLPVVHAVGFHLPAKADEDRLRDDQVLLYRIKFPFLANVFMTAFKYLAIRAEAGLNLVDMRYTSFMHVDDISSFKTAVYIPHNIYLIRTNDMYAMEQVIFLPAAPFIFEFIYPRASTYGGHQARPYTRLGLDVVAQRALHDRLAGSGYRLGFAPSAAAPGEVLPRRQWVDCRLKSVVKIEENEFQTGLNCTEVAAAGSDSTGGIWSQCDELDMQGDSDITPDPSVPEADPFDSFYGDFDAWCGINAYRFWYQYTEYHTMPGLQKFSNTAELLSGVLRFTQDEGAQSRREAVKLEMRNHQKIRQHETVIWWSLALLRTTKGSIT